MQEDLYGKDFNWHGNKAVPEWRMEFSIYLVMKSRHNKDGLYEELVLEEEEEFEETEPLSEENIKDLLDSLKMVALQGDEKSQYHFFQLVTTMEKTISPDSAFMQSIIREAIPFEPYLFQFAKDLAFKTNNIWAAQAGIHILGASKNEAVLPDIKILGILDGLVKHTIAVIDFMVDDPVMDLWDLGRITGHFGIMQVIEELSKYPINQEIKDWILSEGSGMGAIPHDWALTVARVGGLDEKLLADTIDLDLYKCARDLISYLIETESQKEGMYLYEPAATTIRNFVRHAKQHAAEVTDYYKLHKLSEFLRFFGALMEGVKKDGSNYAWTNDCRDKIEDILYSRDWEELVLEGIEYFENKDYYEAKEVASLLGIDTSDYIVIRLQKDPDDTRLWEDVVEHHKPGDVNLLIQLALDHLPWEEYVNVPEEEDSMGGYPGDIDNINSAINLLKAYPGKGEQIILYGLESTIAKHRRSAIMVLISWKRKYWSLEIRDAVDSMRKIEKDSYIRNLLDKFLPDEKNHRTKAELRQLLKKKAYAGSGEWRTEESILNFLRQQTSEEGRLNAAAELLPDDGIYNYVADLTFQESTILFSEIDESDEDAHDISATPKGARMTADLVRLLKEIAAAGDKKSEVGFYAIAAEMKSYKLHILVDDFVKAISKESLATEPYLFRFAYDLLTRSNYRLNVIYGIAILREYGNASVVDELKLLGMHSYFTEYAVSAICRLSNDPASDLWDMAKRVDRLQKIEIVRVLAGLALEDPVKEWLLMEGHTDYQSSNNCLLCAMQGGLHEKLDAEQIDQSLYKAGSALVNGMMYEREVPYKFSYYEHGVPVVWNLIRHGREHARDPIDLMHLLKIEDYLKNVEVFAGHIKKSGWTAEIARECIRDTRQFIDSHDWMPVLKEWYKSDDAECRRTAAEATFLNDLDFEELQK
ncbi:hypothetical protein [Flavihumibacter sp. ZG627]|uniref:hypothetical protein n=1 Tax=Flavihumibacter sp. ZG627 TaxID=1463156 RepID=UPI00057D4F99|nr:hypothetical protein [Flavihumibacter sp. ZG627]KIC89108.1 hypothetical protein HY58_18500 [Flavihumibacter sp. ZG627]